ncbi:hypothetical protein NMY22_g5081 [Coprinellus aureogranulatus]|nr:hypothetical protein NMY22_g5081 [Coprinellus aureogranulatus]
MSNQPTALRLYEKGEQVKLTTTLQGKVKLLDGTFLQEEPRHANLSDFIATIKERIDGPKLSFPHPPVVDPAATIYRLEATFVETRPRDPKSPLSYARGQNLDTRVSHTHLTNKFGGPPLQSMFYPADSVVWVIKDVPRPGGRPP